MYIRNSRREKTINEVPDGYSGTAFFEDKKQNHEDECHDEKPEAVPQKSDDIHKEPSCARANLLPTMKFDLNTIMNTDFLILMLVFLLLSEEKRDDELIVILLLLLVIR